MTNEKRPTVSIIIVNYNGKNYLDICLKSISQQNYHDFEVIVVDNNSNDGSVDFVNKYYPWIKVIESSKNIGFAGGNNLGIYHSTGKYIVLLNNDTCVESDWLINLVSVADVDNTIGAVSSKIIFFKKFLPIKFVVNGMYCQIDENNHQGNNFYFHLKGNPCIETSDYNKIFYKQGFSAPLLDNDGNVNRIVYSNANVLVPYASENKEQILVLYAQSEISKPCQVDVFVGDSLVGSFSPCSSTAKYTFTISSCISEKFGVDLINNAGSYREKNGIAGDIGFGQIERGQFNEQKILNNLCGCSVLIRRTMLEDVGTFDDVFFMYYEDTDLFWRACKRNWQLVYCPSSVVRHIHAGSSVEWSLFFTFYVLRNRFLMVLKNGNFTECIIVFVSLLVTLALQVKKIFIAFFSGTLSRQFWSEFTLYSKIILSGIRHTVPILFARFGWFK